MKQILCSVTWNQSERYAMYAVQRYVLLEHKSVCYSYGHLCDAVYSYTLQRLECHLLGLKGLVGINQIYGQGLELSAIATSNHERVPWDNKHGHLAGDVGRGYAHTCERSKTCENM